MKPLGYSGDLFRVSVSYTAFAGRFASCRRVIQNSGPMRLAIVEGMNARDGRLSNYPRWYNAAPSQDLLVIRRNHKTGEVSLDPRSWGLIPYWCNDPKGGRKPINAKAETVSTLPTFREAYARRRCILRWTGSLSGRRPRERGRSSRSRAPCSTARRSASPGCGRTGRIKCSPRPRASASGASMRSGARRPSGSAIFFAPARRRPRAFHATPQSSRRGAVRGGPDFHLAQAQRRDAASALRAMSRAGC
jgi:hypothetical protein